MDSGYHYVHLSHETAGWTHVWVYCNIIFEAPHRQILIQKEYKINFQGIDILSLFFWEKYAIIQNSFVMSTKLPHVYLYLLPAYDHISPLQHAF